MSLIEIFHGNLMVEYHMKKGQLEIGFSHF